MVGVAGSPALAGVSAGQAGPNGSSTASLSAAVTASDWTTFDHDSLRSGVDPSGNSFSPATPAWTSPTFDGQLYGQPLVATGRVFVATENDTVYALAANTGAVLWSNHLGTPLNPSTVPGLCGDIHPTVGITGTPVIDAARSEIFVVATVSAGSNAAHQLIGLDIYTGTVLLNENIDPPGANPAFQLQRVSLALTDGRVIVGFGGNSGDCDPYHGLVVSAPEDGSAPSTYTVANLPGDSQGAVWMGGAAPSIDAQGNVWVATGNSAFHSASDTYDQSDSVLKLSPTMQLLDSFAPQLWYNDNAGDADLGSTTPALLPNGLVFEVGKSTTAYVLNQSSLGGVNGQVALRNSFCFADGGSADLNGTLFVPCSNGIEAVTPTVQSSDRHVDHDKRGPRFAHRGRGPGVVDWQRHSLCPERRHRCRGPALRHWGIVVVVPVALRRRRPHPGTVLHPDPRLRGSGRTPGPAASAAPDHERAHSFEWGHGVRVDLA